MFGPRLHCTHCSAVQRVALNAFDTKAFGRSAILLDLGLDPPVSPGGQMHIQSIIYIHHLVLSFSGADRWQGTGIRFGKVVQGQSDKKRI